MATERKPRVDPLVPTHALDRRLGNVHVGTPDAEVIAMVEAQLATRTDPRWTPALRRQTIKYAVWRHHQNLADYRNVMGGGHGSAGRSRYLCVDGTGKVLADFSTPGAARAWCANWAALNPYPGAMVRMAGNHRRKRKSATASRNALRAARRRAR